MERKENTPMRETRRRYEERNKEQRKQKSGNFGTMIPRGLFEEINSFLKRYGYTKVQLIEAGYKALQDDAAEHNLALGRQLNRKNLGNVGSLSFRRRTTIRNAEITTE